MRYRINFGFLAPPFAQAWTLFKSQLDNENEFSKSIHCDQCGKWDKDWDGRSPESLIIASKTTHYSDQDEFSENIIKNRSKADRNIILIRHGQYENTATTDEKRCLTEKGREQARGTGRRLKELHRSGIFPFNKMITSTLRRAVETADLIERELCDNISPPLCRKSDVLLCEGAFCQPEPEVLQFSKALVLKDGARIEAAFRQYFHRARPTQDKDSFEILVCHANVILYFVCRALQFPPEAWIRFSTLHHASITWIRILPDGRVTLVCLGETGHFSPQLVTSG